MSPTMPKPLALRKRRSSFGDVDAGIGLVDDIDLDIDVGAEHVALRAIERHAMQRRERIGRHQPTPPSDDVTVIVIVRGFDEHNMESISYHHHTSLTCSGSPHRGDTHPN